MPKKSTTGARAEVRPTYTSVSEFCSEIGLSRASAYAGFRSGAIPHIKLGKRIIIPRAMIAEWLRTGAK